MHRSNQNTGPCNSQVNHVDTPRSVSQHISNNMRPPFDTPERWKRASEHADSSRSEQKYSQGAGPTASDTLRTDCSEDDTSNKTNESQHSDIDETFKTHQNKTPNEESKPEDIQRRIKIRCDKLQSKILFMKKDSRQRITQSERNNKFRKRILDTYRPATQLQWKIWIRPTKKSGSRGKNRDYGRIGYTNRNNSPKERTICTFFLPRNVLNCQICMFFSCLFCLCECCFFVFSLRTSIAGWASWL